MHHHYYPHMANSTDLHKAQAIWRGWKMNDVGYIVIQPQRKAEMEAKFLEESPIFAEMAMERNNAVLWADTMTKEWDENR